MKISVIIATRNRKEDLEISIEGFLKQDYQNFEIIVVDNASSDGTKEMMVEKFDYIKYIWLPDNIDILAQNLGRELSSGDIIWRTDSDAHPKDSNLFSKVVNTFNNYPDIDIISTAEVQVHNNYRLINIHPENVDMVKVPKEGYPISIFMGAGAAIRKSVFDKIGGFWQFGMEEKDFCTRAILAGFEIRYFPNYHTLHYASKNDRDKSNRWLAINRQFLRYIWKFYPFFTALYSSFWVVITALIEIPGLKVKIGAVIQALLSFPEVVISAIRNERKVPPAADLKRVTNGYSIARSQRKYIAERIISKFSKK